MFQKRKDNDPECKNIRNYLGIVTSTFSRNSRQIKFEK